ncbi:SIMPL domain-containing protein [Neobacillus niacini]|uniref:SIMPL domain-containing protein n=1 Tax=Neobacillus niacini TaxID=86668 RepID=UPI0005EE401F|nr:SIMPL domain-containing protein [Neobacillus niacini]
MYNQRPVVHNPQPPSKNIIKVTGEGEIAVQPDTASVNLGVVTESKELIEAQHQNSIIGKKVIDSLIALGIDKNQIQTFDYRIESDYDYDQGKQIFRGYKITQILQVKLEDLSIIGKVVDTAVQNGANYVANIQFTIKYKEAYYQQALALALKNANNKATTIANTIKVNLNPTPILVTEVRDTIQPFETHQIAFAKGVSSTQIEPGQLVIKAHVLTEYKYHSING